MAKVNSAETTAQTNNLAKTTKLKATYVGRSVQQKEGEGKGKKFFKYRITGPAAEIQEYMNSDDFKQYPKYDSDGKTPMYFCRWKDAFGTIGTSYNFNVSIYGTYVLDKEESKDIEDTIEAQELISPTLAKSYADQIVATRLMKNINSSALQQLVEQMAASTGEGTNMNNI